MVYNFRSFGIDILFHHDRSFFFHRSRNQGVRTLSAPPHPSVPGFFSPGVLSPLTEKISILIYHFDQLLKVKDLPTQLEKMDELCHLPGFRHDAKLIEETGKLDYC